MSKLYNSQTQKKVTDHQLAIYKQMDQCISKLGAAAQEFNNLIAYLYTEALAGDILEPSDFNDIIAQMQDKAVLLDPINTTTKDIAALKGVNNAATQANMNAHNLAISYDHDEYKLNFKIG